LASDDDATEEGLTKVNRLRTGESLACSGESPPFAQEPPPTGRGTPDSPPREDQTADFVGAVLFL